MGPGVIKVMSEYTSHYSVLNKESIDFLFADVEENKELLFSDFTFGAGGHTFAILNRSENAKVISFDQDPEALSNGRKRIEKEGVEKRCFLVDSNFENFKNIIDDQFTELVNECGGFDGIVMDLGVSSHHFDSGERGFSFRVDAPLDMRMDVDNDDIATAQEIVNQYSSHDLERIIRDYGEEKFYRRIVRNIVEKRSVAPIETTLELAELVKLSYPAKLRYGKIHPATKVFQALRIEVNRELEVLEKVLDQIVPFLKINGKIAVISFHSLEDRIVKQAFKKLETREDFLFEILTKKPVAPSKDEVSENSRSRSAKLRVVKRVEQKRNKNKYAQFSKVNKN